MKPISDKRCTKVSLSDNKIFKSYHTRSPDRADGHGEADAAAAVPPHTVHQQHLLGGRQRPGGGGNLPLVLLRRGARPRPLVPRRARHIQLRGELRPARPEHGQVQRRRLRTGEVTIFINLCRFPRTEKYFPSLENILMISLV